MYSAMLTETLNCVFLEIYQAQTFFEDTHSLFVCSVVVLGTHVVHKFFEDTRLLIIAMTLP